MKKPPPPDLQKKQDAEDWNRVARTVTPYARKKDAEKHTASKKPLPVQAHEKKDTHIAQKPRPALYSPAASPRGFDAATAQKLRKGKLPIDARLDMHGMTQEEAHRALLRFIALAVRQEKRTLLVITGKGRLSENGGVLRRMLPLWLEEETRSGHVIAVTHAAPKDGGNGAFYVRLRKKRPKAHN